MKTLFTLALVCFFAVNVHAQVKKPVAKKATTTKTTVKKPHSKNYPGCKTAVKIPGTV
ncbi:MAG: hypothetical protein IPF72_02460 [Chitinophagaceae bacterium]|nr:hypothetical protein [Chitinophagaceae bacterium]